MKWSLIMKNVYKLLFVCLLVAALSGCQHEQVPVFTAQAGVNFREQNGEGWSDGVNFLGRIIDLFPNYREQHTMDITYSDLQLSLLIEGNVQDKPLKVKLKLLPVEGFEMPEVVLPDEVIIPAGKASVVFPVKIQRPAKLEVRYCAKVAIDYAHSDVLAGTQERQTYLVGIQDIAALPEEYDGNMTWDEFVQIFESKLGKFGPMKLRLLSSREDDNDIFYHTFATKVGYDGMGFGIGLGENLPDFIKALEQYNAAHPGAPLTEADGTVVTFPEPVVSPDDDESEE